jgi:hypothetical protein
MSFSSTHKIFSDKYSKRRHARVRMGKTCRGLRFRAWHQFTPLNSQPWNWTGARAEALVEVPRLPVALVRALCSVIDKNLHHISILFVAEERIQVSL